MHFLQEVPLPAPLGVSDGGGVRRLGDEDVWTALIDPRGSDNTQHKDEKSVTSQEWTPSRKSMDPVKATYPKCLSGVML